MTVSYTSSVATASHGAFFRLLCRWKGSVYKLIWCDLLVFCIVYATIAFIYHLIPTTSPRLLEIHRSINNFYTYVSSRSNTIQVSFILGFFVTLVVSRWIDQFNYLPTPDGVSLLACAYIQVPSTSKDMKSFKKAADEVAVIRQTITRYVNLASVLCFQSIAPNVRKIYDNKANFVNFGFMTDNELEFFGQLDPRTHPFYIPLMWSITILKRAMKHGFIKHERHLNALIQEILKFRQSLFVLTNYDRVPIPLVYLQVVNIGVYALFVISLISGQFPKVLPQLPANISSLTWGTTASMNISGPISPPAPIPYVPIFTLMEVTFYLGWLKVAQALLNPFGEDDEDFDLLSLIDRNLSISLWMVEFEHGMPTQIKTGRPISERKADEKQTEDLFFLKHSARGDPLTELLAYSADLTTPGTLNQETIDGTYTGSAARLFEKRESRTADSFINLERRASRSVVALVNLLRPRGRSSTESVTSSTVSVQDSSINP